MRARVCVVALLAACGSKGSKHEAKATDAGVVAIASDAAPQPPDEAAFLGDPYEDLSLPAGQMRVTVTRGEANTPVAGVTLHLVALERNGSHFDQTFTTNADGVVGVAALAHDGATTYHVLGVIDGDRLESAPITPRDHGVRLDLHARASGGEGLPPLTGIPELEAPVPDGEAWISVAAAGGADLTLVDLANSASRTPTTVAQESLGPVAHFTGLTPGAVYVAHARNSAGHFMSRPLLAISGVGVGRAFTAMEGPAVRCYANLTRDPDALHGWTRCDVWQSGGIPRALAKPLILPLPEGAKKPTLHAGTAAQLAGGAVTWSGTVPPGTTAVDVEYTLPVTAGHADVAIVSAQGLSQIGFLIEAGMTVEVSDVTGGQYRAPDFRDGDGRHRVWADATHDGDRLAFTISGATPPTPCELLGASRWTADGHPAPAPDVGGESSNGGAQVTLSSLRGKPVVLNLFASWSQQSVKEIASLTALARVMPQLGAELVVVSSDQTWDDVKTVIDPGSGLTVWLDRPKAESAVGDAAYAFGTTKLPETYLIDAEGLVRSWIVNTRDWTSLDALACIQSLKTPWTGPVAVPPPPYQPVP